MEAVRTEPNAGAAVLKLHVQGLVVRRRERVGLNAGRRDDLLGSIVLLASRAHEPIIKFGEGLVEVLVDFRVGYELIPDEIGTQPNV